MRKWLQTYFGWIPGFLDWVDNTTKRVRTVGILITLAIGTHDFIETKGKHQAEHDRDKYSHKSDSLQHKADSCIARNINNKY